MPFSANAVLRNFWFHFCAQNCSNTKSILWYRHQVRLQQLDCLRYTTKRLDFCTSGLHYESWYCIWGKFRQLIYQRFRWQALWRSCHTQLDHHLGSCKNRSSYFVSLVYARVSCVVKASSERQLKIEAQELWWVLCWLYRKALCCAAIMSCNFVLSV